VASGVTISNCYRRVLSVGVRKEGEPTYF
jgi:hypothetical protein